MEEIAQELGGGHARRIETFLERMRDAVIYFFNELVNYQDDTNEIVFDNGYGSQPRE